MEKIKSSNLWKWLIKVCLTALAIYWVSRKIDFNNAFQLLKQISPLYLMGGILLFNSSKIVSAIRLNIFLSNIGLHLDQVYNTALYYRGMFYNLFLPGGIGGDGYKIYILHKKFNTSGRELFRAILFDRISGMISLVAILLVLLLFLLSQKVSTIVSGSFGLMLLLCYPLHLLALKIAGKKFIDPFLKTTGLSLITQLLQVCAAWFLLKSLGVDDGLLEYLAAFLISSVATIIPLTIGGIGAREMTFVLLAPYTTMHTDQAIAFSLLFFLVTIISSVPGIFLEKETNQLLPAERIPRV